ncbi:MAG: putative porin, partial [Gammaproteobacteria bacterium]|nr:putative porin [Gammaproteobacteria bacterium]
MKKLTVLLGLSILLFSTSVLAQVSEAEIQALRDQIEMLNQRLDQLEAQNRQLTEDAEKSHESAVAQVEETVNEKIDTAVTEQVDERMAAVSWAERIRWKGDFRYRYENIDEEGKDGRNRSRIRARTNLEADLSPTLQVGVGLATGGDDPVSSNQTIGGGGSSKDIKIDLAYFEWTGLDNTSITGGKFKNYLIRPGGKGLRWDGDWRPEGLGAIWDNDRFYVQGLGTWLEGDSRNGTEFAWALQGGVKFKTGADGTLSIGVGYTEFDVAGRTPLFGDQDDFYGNSFVEDPNDPNNLVFAYDYRNYEVFLDWKMKLGGHPFALFGNYTVNDEAPENDTGYLFGAKFGSAKDRGQWDVTYFYQKLEADATVGLLSDSDFGGGGTDAKGHVLSGTYAFHKSWNFKATYFI